MKIEIKERTIVNPNNKVIIAPRLKKESIHIDGNGNIIDPKTKQIIQKNKP